MTPLLININTTSPVPQIMLANQVRGWFQENGNLPIEHGFEPVTFIYKGKVYRPYEFSERGVSARVVDTKEINTISWNMLPSKTIKKLVKNCNLYYTYVTVHA